MTWVGTLLVMGLLQVACGGGGDGDGPAPLAAAVTVSNLRSGGMVETGFAIGTASAVGLTEVQVSLDGSAWSPATGTSDWRFQLPTGAATWRDATTHTIRVRATDGTAYSTPVAVTVRKGNNKDVNGDGYADLVAGAFGYNSNQGRAYLFYSAGVDGVTTSTAATANAIITGEATSNDFGVVTALGDVNSDGYADVVIGASFYSVATGRIYVFHSAGTGGVTATAAASADRIITGENSPDFFGYTIILGDVNGDGYADIATGAYNYSTSTGRAYVFHSAGAAGVTTTTAGAADTIITGEATRDFLGCAVALGDVNGDGYPDLVIGAFKAGKVYVFHSSSAGVGSANASTADTIIVHEPTLPAELGGTVAVGDVNGDGYADVVSGDYRYNGNAGRVYVFHSAGTAGVTITEAASASAKITGDVPLDALGYAMVVGDVNGDGYADVIPAAYYHATGTGRAYVFHSAGAAGVATAAAAAADTILTGEGTNNDFGVSVTVGDLNGDGFRDVIVGAQSYSAGWGRVYSFHSAGAAGVPTAAAASADNIITGQAGGSFFGMWVSQ